MERARNNLKDLRQFGMMLAGISAVFGFIHCSKEHFVISQLFFWAGLSALCISLFAPGSLKPVYAVFLKVAHAIGWFNTRVILILIYFVIVTPISVMMRIVGKDSLDRKTDKDRLTYWAKRPVPKAIKEKLEKQF